jgi:lipoprotein-anchoring transpeptidase ErfK/SrfK
MEGSQGSETRTRLHAVVAVLLLAVAEAKAQEKTPVSRNVRIVVSIPDRKLALVEDGRVRRVYPVAVGARVSPSPTGEFRIVSRISRPTYYHPGVVIPPGKDNPLGTRWVGLDRKGYGIHGTNEPWSIGKPASHGCIRMAKADLEELFTEVRVGDVVEIRAQRAPETLALFGPNKVSALLASKHASASAVGGGQ